MGDNSRPANSLTEALEAVIKSVIVGGLLSMPACCMIPDPDHAPFSERIGLWAAYAIVALAYFQWKKTKEVLPEGDRPGAVFVTLVFALIAAVVVGFLLMLVLMLVLIPMGLWEENVDFKKCLFVVVCFVCQSVLYWSWLREKW
jgi:hypothetical protein